MYNKYMSKYVDPVVAAAERLDLDQILSCRRDNTSWGPLLGTLFHGRAPPCSPLPTLPGVASAVLASCRDRSRKIVFPANFMLRNAKYLVNV